MAQGAAENGILMRTGEAFQGFRLVSKTVVDKTGTLTGAGRGRALHALPSGDSKSDLCGEIASLLNAKLR